MWPPRSPASAQPGQGHRRRLPDPAHRLRLRALSVPTRPVRDTGSLRALRVPCSFVSGPIGLIVPRAIWICFAGARDPSTLCAPTCGRSARCRWRRTGSSLTPTRSGSSPFAPRTSTPVSVGRSGPVAARRVCSKRSCCRCSRTSGAVSPWMAYGRRADRGGPDRTYVVGGEGDV